MNQLSSTLIKQTALRHELDVFDARRGVLESVMSLGFTRSQAYFVVTALTELGNNVVFHSLGGTLSVEQVVRHPPSPGAGLVGIRIVTEDTGPGIADVNLALKDGYSTVDSLGCGLSGVNRLMDELHIDSSPAGTRVLATLWSKEAS